MQHNKPAISLRRPPPPPTAAVEAFITGRPDAQTSGHLAVVPDPASEHPDVQTSGQPGDQVAEQPSAQAPEHPADQATGRPDVETPERPSTRRTRRPVTRAAGRPDVRPVGVVERADGRQRRRLTVYLPVELARRLVVHCAAGELEISDVVTDAVERELERG